MESRPTSPLLSKSSQYFSPVNHTGESTLFRALRAYYLVFIHVLLAFATAVMMKYFVDGSIVSNANGERFQDGTFILRASDIITIISATLVVVRLITSSLVAVSAWRCAFILLETEGLHLRQFNRIVSWHLPWPLWGSRNFLLVVLVLLLMLPSSLVSPLLSGAVDWGIIQKHVDSGSVRSGKPASLKAGSLVGWKWYLVPRGEDALLRVTSATGLASLAWSSSADPDIGSCRHVMTTPLPVGSIVQNVTLPCLTIHSISWDETPLPKNVTDLILDTGNISLLKNGIPFALQTAGNAVVFNSSTWRSNELYQAKDNISNPSIPPPLQFTGVKKVALLLVRHNSKNNCTTMEGNPFGADDTPRRYRNNLWGWRDDNAENCFIVGTVNFTAGVIVSPESRYVTNRVVEAQNISEIKPDPWVGEALYMMPDVMSKISIMNASDLPTWENVDDYVSRLLRYSYQGSWDSLDMAYSTSPITYLKTQRPVDMLQANVSFPRVVAWLGVQLLLTLSTLILLVMQAKCRRNVIVDIAAAAITTDPRPLLEKESGLTNLSYITSEDDRIGKLRLRETADTARFALVPS